MANMGGVQKSESLWMKASELNFINEESRLPSLELPRLKSFFPFGLSRGSLVEINGAKSSGRTSLSLYILSESISKGEVCAYVDLSSQFNPASLTQTGVSLHPLAWIRCNGNAEHAIRSVDLLLHAGGFGMVLLDLCGANPSILNKIPLSYWFRFKRAIENTPTILLICGEHQQARSCSRNGLQIQAKKFHWTGQAPNTLLLALESTATPRKSAQSKITVIRPESLLIPAAVA